MWVKRLRTRRSWKKLAAGAGDRSLGAALSVRANVQQRARLGRTEPRGDEVMSKTTALLNPFATNGTPITVGRHDEIELPAEFDEPRKPPILEVRRRSNLHAVVQFWEVLL